VRHGAEQVEARVCQMVQLYIQALRLLARVMADPTAQSPAADGAGCDDPERGRLQ